MKLIYKSVHFMTLWRGVVAPAERMVGHLIRLKKGTRTLACRTSSPLFHSSPLYISYHLFLSCTKPDEGHLTNVPIAMQKSNILAAPWPVNIWTLLSWQDLPLLSATLWLPSSTAVNEIKKKGCKANARQHLGLCLCVLLWLFVLLL